MQDISAAFAALKEQSHTVVFIVHLAGAGNRTLSTYPVRHSGPWRFDEGLIFDDGVTLWDAQHEAYGHEIAHYDQSGIGSISHELNSRDGTSRVSGVNVILLNHQDYAEFTSLAVIDNTVLRVLAGFEGLGYSEYLPIFHGVIDQYSITRTSMALDAIDATFKLHRDLSVQIGLEYYPGVPTASRGRAIPIILGRNVDVETIQITGPANGTLAFDLGLDDLVLDLVEAGATFPSTGTITIGTGIGAEANIIYTQALPSIFNGKTYLRLFDLVRPAPLTHVAGESVTLTNVVYTYLIGYSVYDLSAVRIDGVLFPQVKTWDTPGFTWDDGVTLWDEKQYQFIQNAPGADRPVSLLVFTFDPGGVVTVDVRGGNFVPQPLFFNGGFETGDATGWTASTGALAITSGAAYEGTYKAEVLGGLLTFEDVYADFATVPGNRYTIAFYYRDQEEGTNLLTNGGFESGVLAPWVQDSDPAGGGVYVFFQDVGVHGIYIPNTGAYCLAIGNAPGIGDGFLGSVYIDVATGIATDYVLTLWYHGSSGSNYQGKAAYAIGVPGDPESITAVELPSPIDGISVVPRDDGYRIAYSSPLPISFAATGTTTRITLRGTGDYFGSQGNPIEVLFDDVRLIEAGNVERSQSGIKLGTPLDDNLHAEITLPRSLGYSQRLLTFNATTPITRLTLQSQYDVLPIASFFDNFSVQDAGLSAVEAIHHILTTFLPAFPIRESSFNAAAELRSAWIFGTTMRDPGESRALLQRMATQCACWYYEDSQGRATLVAQPLPVAGVDPVSLYTFDTSNMLDPDSVRVQVEPLDNVYTEFYVHYNFNGSGGREDPESYSGIAYATPTKSSFEKQGYEQRCQFALGTYGRAHRLDVYADMIQEIQTANLLLNHLVRTRTERQRDVAFTVDFRAVHLERGDIIRVDIPLLYTNRVVYATVQQMNIVATRATVDLVARTFVTLPPPH